MITSETISAVAPALVKAQSEMTGVAKEGNNPAFRSKYITLDSILDTVRPILAKNGMILTQGSKGDIVDGKYMVTVYSRVIHTSGEWLQCEVSIPLTKYDAHGTGSALTYGRRYSASALLAISADEDDDGNGSIGQAPAKPQYQQARPTYNKPQQPQATTPKANAYVEELDPFLDGR
jgi:hypothetical protein